MTSPKQRRSQPPTIATTHCGMQCKYLDLLINTLGVGARVAEVGLVIPSSLNKASHPENAYTPALAVIRMTEQYLSHPDKCQVSIRLLSIFILLNATTAFGQLKITGRVTDTHNEPLPGASIVVKGSVVGTLSNTNGEFELNTRADSVLLSITYVGFKPYELQVYKSSFVEIQLSVDNDLLDFGSKPLKLPVVNKKDCDGVDLKFALAFINDSFTSDTSKFNLSSETDIGFFGIDSLVLKDTLFTTEDVKFICVQLACVADYEWKQNQIRGATVIKGTKTKRIFKNIVKGNGWVKFRKKYGECLNTFGFPVFTVNREYCLFCWWTQCDWLAGGGNIALYKKSNGKWEQVKIYKQGVS